MSGRQGGWSTACIGQGRNEDASSVRGRVGAYLAAEGKEGLLTAQGLGKVALLLCQQAQLMLARAFRSISRTLRCGRLARLNRSRV